MVPEMQDIARRIKELRDINGMSIETLAKEFKVNIEDYKRYESGLSDIPLGFLFQIAGKFNVDMTALVTGEEPRLKVFSVVKKNRGIAVNRRKEYKYQDLAFNFIDKKAEVFYVTVDPISESKPSNFYSHKGQEINFVLQGTLKVFIDTHEVTLEEGDCLYLDSGHKHAMLALNNKSASFLAVIL
jgi:transcriptional regulator with XRE-family HTH domain